MTLGQINLCKPMRFIKFCNDNLKTGAANISSFERTFIFLLFLFCLFFVLMFYMIVKNKHLWNYL